MALQGLRVLVTRPGAAAGQLAEALRQAGAQPLLFPALAIEAVAVDEPGQASQAIKTQILDFDHNQIAIFISMNAVSAGLDWLEHYWPQQPVGIDYYAVGAATARALAARGVQARSPGGAENSEALLALPALQQLHGQRVLIFRGSGGRETLAQQLRERGAQVAYCEVYRRVLPSPEQPLAALLANSSIDILTAASGETLQNMLTLAGAERQTLLRLPVVVPGPRVAGLARQLGFAEVISSVNASPTATVSALNDWENARDHS